MALSVVASSKADSTTGTALSLAMPTGTTAGDFVVVIAHANGQTTIADNNKTVAAATLTSGNDAAGVTSKATASVTLTAYRLYLLTVTTRTASGDPNHATATSTGATWVEVNSNNYDSTGSQKRTTVLRAMVASNQTGAITIDFAGQTQSDVVWSIDEITNVDTSGTNGSGAVVQSAVNSNAGGGGTLTTTLAAFGSSNNATWGACSIGNGSGTSTAGTGFAKVSENATASNLRLMTEFKNSNDTTVDYTESTTTAELGGIAIEIKANSGFTIAPNFTDYKPNTTNGHTMTLFSRTIQAGDPSTYNFTSGASGRWAVIAITYRDSSAPSFDVAPNTANAANDDSASTGTINAPSITTGVANTIHTVFCGWDTSATGTITTPSGYTLLQNANSGGEPLHASYKAIVSASAAGTVSNVNTEFGAMIASSFSVKGATAASLIKTVNGLAIASVKSVNGLSIASVKTINGLTNV